MKKNLFTCFLALLCLYGSTGTAQVADSPTAGADFLHRSGPHRGGETRSDVILRNTPHEIDGGLWIEDRGQFNETATSAQKPPRSDVHETAVDSGRWTVDGQQSEFSLIDTTGSARQEGAIPYAQVGRLHLELPIDNAPDTLWLTYWEHFLKEHSEVTPGIKVPLVGEMGTFFEGSAGFKVYRWELLDMAVPLTFSIRNGQNHLFRYWSLGYGDEVKIRLDLNSGRSFFSGPSAAFFSAQYEVDRLAGEERFQAMPLMVTGNPERMLSDSLTSALYKRSLGLPAALYTPMIFVIPGQTDVELVGKYLNKPLESYHLIRQLPTLMRGLDDTHAQLIGQRAFGATLKLILSRISLGKARLKEEPYASQFRSLVASIPIPVHGSSISPDYLAALYDLTLLRGSLSGQPLVNLLEAYPKSVSDRILGLYLLDQFKRLEGDQTNSVSQVLDEVELSWIRELVLDLQAKSLTGTPLRPAKLIDLEGNPFDLARLEGKAVVISFWISGCRFCVRYYQNTLESVFNQWSDRDDVIFVSVNADSDQSRWRREVSSEMYSHPDMIQLHQDAGSGILAEYHISTFPQKLLVSPDHRLFLLTTTQYSSERLSEKISEMLAIPSALSESNPSSQ